MGNKQVPWLRWLEVAGSWHQDGNEPHPDKQTVVLEGLERIEVRFSSFFSNPQWATNQDRQKQQTQAPC
jgi:hypothetical protein